MSRKGAKQRVIEVKPAPPVHLIDRIFALPRFARILIAVVPALALTFIISPIVDELYLRFFFSPSTVELPSWVTAAVAIAMYFAGWYFLVGYGEAPSRQGIRRYLTFSSVVIMLAIAWFVILAVLNIVGAAE